MIELKESLFHRILTRASQWTLLKKGANLQTAVRLYWRKARYYLDELHDFVIEMSSLKYARIKVGLFIKKLLIFDLKLKLNFIKRFKSYVSTIPWTTT